MILENMSLKTRTPVPITFQAEIRLCWEQSRTGVSKGANCERARATKHRGIRCFWSTSCLTEQHDGCNVCLRHEGGGGQRVEQPAVDDG